MKEFFYDVPNNHWCCGYIEAAFKNNIINGAGARYFSPDAPITREDIAVILYRSSALLGFEQTQNQQSDFVDADSISGYAVDAVSMLSGLGVINGTGNGAFEPKRNATRAEAAKMIYEITLLSNKK